MPNQAHSGIQGKPWHRCARCGTDVRLSQLQWQDGQLVCSVYDCTDDLENERRQRFINDKLRNAVDMQIDPKLRENYVDDTIDQF